MSIPFPYTGSGNIVLIAAVQSSSSPYNLPWRPREGVEVQLYSFFNLGARWTWVVNATTRPLYPRETDPLRIVQGLVEPQDRSGRVRKISPPPGFDPRTFQPLYRLNYPGPHLCNNNDNLIKLHAAPGSRLPQHGGYYLPDCRPTLTIHVASENTMSWYHFLLRISLLFIYRIMSFGSYFTTRSDRSVSSFNPRRPLVQVLVQPPQFQRVIMKLSVHSESIQRSVGASRLPAAPKWGLKGRSVKDYP
jgi:hypothetical protein